MQAEALLIPLLLLDRKHFRAHARTAREGLHVSSQFLSRCYLLNTLHLRREATCCLAPDNVPSEERSRDTMWDRLLTQKGSSSVADEKPAAKRRRSKRDLLPAEEVVTRYQAGESLAALAESYGTSTGTVRNLLKEQDVPLRSRAWKFGKDGTGGYRGGVMDSLPVSEIISEYRDGATLAKLAKDHEVSVTTIVTLLDSRGEPRRSSRQVPWKGRSRVLTTEQEAEVVRRYQEGQAQRKIARDFKVSYGAVLGVLRRHGLVQPPKSASEEGKEDE
ncbi:helix-turn-helix domain-containing protein [Streptomyces griseofuscus]|uniref:helix-turn-helix domain-containing protein n=1 Tax=Streptomyces griseofuscus TaxID=146922 RepID=UPI0036A0A537